MELLNIFKQPGIIISLFLLAIPIILMAIYVIIKAKRIIRFALRKREYESVKSKIKQLSNDELDELRIRQQELDFQLRNNELSGELKPLDKRGVIKSLDHSKPIPFIERKKRIQPRHKIDNKLTKLILWFIGSAVFWLVIGTSIGEYLGIKFNLPDIDHISWLSFGRLRPVHTNMVFWGWASLAMIGLAYYVVPRVSNAENVNIKRGYTVLALINTAVTLGSICLMAGINNGGGEYREYIWPVMLLFGIGVALSLSSFIKLIAKRTTKEIYVSNWYIISAMMFLLVIAFVAYWPTWQDGLGETIIQGYYMHQGVGMWFMLFNLGLMYYFLPQQLNKPIYSYSLGVLAFWAQILFYTLIGTHHFIFSAIPWWLQTVAIIGSVGMIIPVVSGTANFLLTFRSTWGKVFTSYTLPFYFVGIIFYFTGSMQGTAEAFRYTNQIWHFTDFTVAHSHLTMYGIISFMLWGFIYTLIPRLTGREPKQLFIGAHFWLAFIGLLFYTVPLMYGSTLKGIGWMDNKPFIDGVSMMKPYWLWRAIGGSLMWLSHLIFAYNFYKMVKKNKQFNIPTEPQEILKMREQLDKQIIKS
ncbi:MAG: cbb3-type cytochrome c oxidase subunit I [Bacteroidetes bacterium]|nr:cbb3-type cytochrome c oxidase subunit I [Bacteroidota bacterium]